MGTFERQLAESARERLRAPTGVSGEGTAGAGDGGPDMVGRVGVQAPLHGACRQPQDASADGELDGAQVEAIRRARTYEGVDLGDELRPEGLAEPPL